MESVKKPVPAPSFAGGTPTRAIFQLVWPQFLMMLFQFLVGFIDVYVAGKVGASTQAAFGMVVQCFFFVLIVGTTIAGASVTAISQAIGAGLPLRARRYLGLVLNMGAVSCFVIVFTSYIFRQEFLSLLQVPENIFDLTLRIFIIYLCIVPSEYVTIFSSALFRAHKRVSIPLATSIVVCLVNTFLDFGLGLGMFGLPYLGADGIAFATLGSSVSGAAFNLYMLYRKGYLSRASFAPLRWQRRAVGYLIKVGIPSGAMQTLWQTGYLVLFAIAASLPFNAVGGLAGMSAGMRIESLLFLPGAAFSLTGTILVGNILGAGNKQDARRVALRIILLGSGLMSLVAVCLWPFVPQVAGWLTSDQFSKDAAIMYLRFNLVSTPFTVSSMILSGIMTGAGATIYTLVVYGCATWLVRLPLAWFLGHVLWQSASGVFCAMLVSQIFQATIIMYIFLNWDWTRFALYEKRSTRRVRQQERSGLGEERSGQGEDRSGQGENKNGQGAENL